MSTFNVDQSFFVTGMLNILTQTADARTVSASITLDNGQSISLTSVLLSHSTSGPSMRITMQGFLNLPYDATVASVAFNITYRFSGGIGGTDTASSVIDNLSVSLAQGLYLVMLNIDVVPQPAEVYL